MAVAPKLVPFDYVLIEDREKEPDQQTIWHLRPLTYEEREITQPTIETSGEEVKVSIKAMTLARKVLNFGLEGWDNYCDGEGRELEFSKANESFPYGGKKGRQKREFLPDYVMDLIAPHALELSNAVTEASQLREDAAKNCG